MLPNAVISTTRVRGQRWRISAKSSTPFMYGMRMSLSTRAYSWWSSSVSASPAEYATSTLSGSSPSSMAMPSAMSRLSSTTSTRVSFTLAIPWRG